MGRSAFTKNGNIIFDRLSDGLIALQVGCLVSSTKGRDKGRFYLVVGCDGLPRVHVADGEGRKVENPKQKNIKHLHVYEAVAGAISNKAANGERITDLDVRQELKSLLQDFAKCPS